MRHTLVLDVSEETYGELARISGERGQTPELVASMILNDLLPDPLLRLAGVIKSPIRDIGERHDEYLGQELLATHDE